jgi:hypothetical protein
MAVNFDTEIYELNQAIDYVGRPISETFNYEKYPKVPGILQTGFGLYNQYFKLAKKEAKFPKDPRVVSYDTFREFVTGEDLKIIIAFFEEISKPAGQQPTQQAAPNKEESTVPQDLEALVAQYQENQADKILSSDNSNSVEAAVKRARQTWETRHRIELIQKNREEARKESDRFFENSIDPKTGNREESFKQAKDVLEKVIAAQAAILEIDLTKKEVEQATEDLLYLTTAGAVDIDNLYQLNIASQLALRNVDGKEFTSPLEKIDIENTYTDDPQIDEELAENYYRTSTKILSQKLHANELEDFDEKVGSAKKSIDNLQSRLTSVIPNAKLPSTPLKEHRAELETALRQADPSLRINPEGLGTKAAATLETVKGQQRDLSPEVITLYSSGLTPDKFKKAEDIAKNDPNSPLGKLYRSQPDVFDQVRFQLNKLHSSKLGQEISSRIKPLSGLSENLTNTFNKLPPGVQGAARLILNPTGTVSNWINRKIGQNIGNQLIKVSGSALSQKLGSYLLKEGFTGGIKAFTSEAAKKLAIKAAGWAATKLGVSLAAESLNGIAPGLGLLVDIAIQFALWLGEKTIGAVYSSFQ